ncbi:hypothetical protein COU13_01800, partial [Candidatus Kaiserbacteria bacterium CG10_big_fil_rev_8_21_14_0_10_43_70]
TDDNKTETITIPSMGLPLCAAFENIDNVWNLTGGERIEVRGELVADRNVMPCEDAGHYLRVEMGDINAGGNTSPNSNTNSNTNGNDGGQMIACTMDAKICPDGSAVGRVGPNCAFAPCPGENGNSTGGGSITVSAGIDETVHGLQVALTPRAVLEDSRCPKDVVCVWAGTVRLQSTLSSGLGTANQVFELNKSITTEAEIVTLVAVRPAPVPASVINSNDYEFDFLIEKR